MRARYICLALAVVLVCPFASAQWVQTSLSLPDSSWVYCFAVSGTNLLAGTLWGGGVFLSTNNGSSWSAVNEGLARDSIDPTRVVDVYCLESTGESLFAGTGAAYSGGGIFRSTNNGSNWTAVDSGISYGGAEILQVRALAVCDTNLLAGIYKNTLNHGSATPSGDYVYRSIDGGTSWLMCAEWLDFSIYSLAVSATNIYAGGAGVFRSTDGGTDWTLASPDLPHPGVFAFAVSESNLFAGAYDGVFLSTNNGNSWSAAGLTSTLVNALAAIGTNLFAGTYDRGVWISTNKGASWTAVNSGLKDTSVSALAVLGTNLFAGTNNGVWRRPLSEMITDVDNKTQLPQHFSIEQNYPNPFNPSTTIKYELPKSSIVRLSVYDLLGREVSVLVNERRDAGVHEVKFDGSGLSSGVYLYRIRAGDFVRSKRLVLLK